MTVDVGERVRWAPVKVCERLMGALLIGSLSLTLRGMIWEQSSKRPEEWPVDA